MDSTHLKRMWNETAELINFAWTETGPWGLVMDAAIPSCVCGKVPNGHAVALCLRQSEAAAQVAAMVEAV